MARTYGSYMMQPTKDELRSANWQLRCERDSLKAKADRLSKELEEATVQLNEAYRILGKQKVDDSLSNAG